MMVKTSSKLFLDTLEQDDIYHGPDDAKGYTGAKYEDEIKATHAGLKKQLDDLRIKAEHGNLNAYSVQLKTIDGRLAAIGQKLNSLNSKVEEINENIGDFKPLDVVRPGKWFKKNRLKRDEGKLEKKSAEVSQEQQELLAIEKTLDHIDNELYCKHGIVSEKRAKIIYDEMIAKGVSDPAAALTAELNSNINKNGKTSGNKKGMISNVNSTLNTYRDKAADLIRDNTNASPEQAKNIATIMKWVIIGYAVKKWRTDVDGVVNKGLAIAGAYALWAAAFGEGDAPEIIDGWLNNSGMNIPGFNGKTTDTYTQSANQFGLTGSDYESFKSGKTTSDGFLNNVVGNIKGDSGVKNAFLKKYVNGDKGNFNLDAQKLIADSGMEPHDNAKSEVFMAQFDSDDHNPQKEENVIKFIAYLQSRINKGEEVVINSELTKYLDHIGVTGADLTFEGIKKKEAEKKGAIESEMKAKKDAEMKNTLSTLPAGRKIKEGKEGEISAFIEKRKDLPTTNPGAKVAELVSAGLIEPIPTPHTEITKKVTELEKGGIFNASRTPSQKEQFTSMWFECRNKMSEFGGNPALSSIGGKLYLHAFNCSIELNISNPNEMFITTPGNNDFAINQRDTNLDPMAKLFYVAHATSGIISTLKKSNFNTKDEQPFEVWSATAIINIKNNSNGFRDYLKSIGGQNGWQKMIRLADLSTSANEPSSYVSFLNQMKTDKVLRQVGKKGSKVNVYESLRTSSSNKVPKEYSRKDNISVDYEQADPTGPDTKTIKTFEIKDTVLGPLRIVGDIVTTGVVEFVGSTDPKNPSGASNVLMKVVDSAGGLTVNIAEEGGKVVEKTFDAAIAPLVRSSLALLSDPKVNTSIKTLITNFIGYGSDIVSGALGIIKDNKDTLDKILGGLVSQGLDTANNLLGSVKEVSTAIKDKAPKLLEDFSKILEGASGALAGLAKGIEADGLGAGELFGLYVIKQFFGR